MNKCDHNWKRNETSIFGSNAYICSKCEAEISEDIYQTITHLKNENLRLNAEAQFIEKCKTDKSRAEYTSGQRMKVIQQLVTEKTDLLNASRLVLRSFAYSPGAGPEWYEATRIVVGKIRNGI